MIDILEEVPLAKQNLLGNRGFVRIMDVSPRICPEGRTPEFAIVEAARISYAKSEPQLKSITEDNALINYLLRHNHGSPFEMASVKFHIEAPIFVARQWFRHRTGKYNEMSLRYVEVDEKLGMSYFSPLDYEQGFRVQSKTNKQNSELDLDQKSIQDEYFKRANVLLDQLFEIYHDMCSKNIPRELARTILPVSTYTHFVFEMDLRNLMGFLKQRSDIHAQHEIKVYADAIIELLKPIFPECINYMLQSMNSITLSPMEIEIFKGQRDISEVGSKGKQRELQEKLNKLK